MTPDADYRSWNLFGLEELFPAVNQRIAEDDSMLHAENRRHYFEVGAAALAAMLTVLQVARIPETRIDDILDFACGYGRVARWLRARFPKARILGADRVLKAVTSLKEVLGVEAQQVGSDFEIPLPRSFDLIWNGSLITHLSAEKSRRAIAFMASYLKPGGIVILTAHGPYVEQRIRLGQKVYGLREDQVEALLSGYAETGYGFGLHPNQSAYGISANKASWIVTTFEEIGLVPVFYGERFWNRHHDVFAAIRPETGSAS